MTCPDCRHPEVFLSHRQGFLETGPLSWAGVLPFRCGHCWARFYRRAPKNIRRRLRAGEPLQAAGPVRAHWPEGVAVRVTVAAGEGGAVELPGTAERVSHFGLRLRLAQPLPVATPVRIAVNGSSPRAGRVTWSDPQGSAETLHVLRFDAPLDSFLLQDLTHPGA